MKIYILNSMLYCINDAIFGIVWMATAPLIYDNENIIFHLSPKFDFMFYVCYIYINLNVVLGTFCVFMDIYIAYSRIQIFKPNLKFLLKTPVRLFKANFSFIFLFFKLYLFKVKIISFTILIISIIVNIPICISREVITYKFTFNGTNSSLVLYSYGIIFQ
jgi:hypothetical protein